MHARPDESTIALLRPVPRDYDDSSFPCSDLGNAESFAAQYGDRIRYDHRQKVYLVWESHRWRIDDDGEVWRLATDAIRQRGAAAFVIDDRQARDEHVRWALQSESRQRIDAMLGIAKNLPPISDRGDSWDSNPFLFGCANGVIDLQTGQLRPGRFDDRITAQSPVDFDPDATAPRWGRFLQEIFDGDTELIEWLQRAIGYSLTGDTSEQCLWLLHGSGSNGKSVFLNTLLAMLGDYGMNTRFATLESQKRSSGGATTDIAALAGRRFVTASEVGRMATFDEARVKSLTGGDPVRARRLYQEEFTFAMTAKFWLGVNHRPTVHDDSFGFWRRVRLVPFTQQFTSDNADKNLEAKLREELPGILAWAVRGCLAWQERGLDPLPDAVTKAVDDYREDSDPIATFVTDRLEERPGAEATLVELWEAYGSWAESQKIPERERLSRKNFSARLSTRYTKTRARQGMTFTGVAVGSSAGSAYGTHVDKYPTDDEDVPF